MGFHLLTFCLFIIHFVCVGTSHTVVVLLLQASKYNLTRLLLETPFKYLVSHIPEYNQYHNLAR